MPTDPNTIGIQNKKWFQEIRDIIQENITPEEKHESRMYIMRIWHPDFLPRIIEDYQIPYGEKAYQNGFLFLDTLQLKMLRMMLKLQSLLSVLNLPDYRIKQIKNKIINYEINI